MSTNSTQAFKDLLLVAIGNLKKLLQVVEQEYQLLQTGASDAEELEALTEKKNQLLQQIEVDVDQRKEFLKTQDLNPDMDGLESFFASLPEANAAALRKGWNQLISLLEKIHQQNNINGRLINRALQHFDVLLNAMQETQGKVRVYHPSGGAGDLNIPRNLGKA
ncbi:FlgN protein [Marinospirillum celere]|uniref:FlgN protein n=1 Tax=Marinospirillum celere TaxID=1122252 RepID=A0A1I1FF43_9GAMM|nr:flagellar protein FlgN [Marinospirillum celere]SFB98079.1 FlgN protein [Marinospirillum celere]